MGVCYPTGRPRPTFIHGWRSISIASSRARNQAICPCSQARFGIPDPNPPAIGCAHPRRFTKMMRRSVTPPGDGPQPPRRPRWLQSRAEVGRRRRGASRTARNVAQLPQNGCCTFGKRTRKQSSTTGCSGHAKILGVKAAGGLRQPGTRRLGHRPCLASGGNLSASMIPRTSAAERTIGTMTASALASNARRAELTSQPSNEVYFQNAGDGAHKKFQPTFGCKLSGTSPGRRQIKQSRQIRRS
jgi:hypothetical protein